MDPDPAPDPAPDPTPSFGDFKDAKKFIFSHIFSHRHIIFNLKKFTDLYL
jgi:hypothetical protein